MKNNVLDLRAPLPVGGCVWFEFGYSHRLFSRPHICFGVSEIREASSIQLTATMIVNPKCHASILTTDQPILVVNQPTDGAVRPSTIDHVVLNIKLGRLLSSWLRRIEFTAYRIKLRWKCDMRNGAIIETEVKTAMA